MEFTDVQYSKNDLGKAQVFSQQGCQPNSVLALQSRSGKPTKMMIYTRFKLWHLPQDWLSGQQLLKDGNYPTTLEISSAFQSTWVAKVLTAEQKNKNVSRDQVVGAKDRLSINRNTPNSFD